MGHYKINVAFASRGYWFSKRGRNIERGLSHCINSKRVTLRTHRTGK